MPYPDAKEEDDEGGDAEEKERLAGQDLIDALESGDPKQVYAAWEHAYRVCTSKEEEPDDGEPHSGKHPLVIAIGKAKPPGKE